MCIVRSPSLTTQGALELIGELYDIESEILHSPAAHRTAGALSAADGCVMVVDAEETSDAVTLVRYSKGVRLLSESLVGAGPLLR
ncbi:hypothetical protein [Budvicia aquatica]|nr:hypothetical protein [Budvicia aquatica]PHI30152.1 hypothetical protein CRN84_12760 [Budvicia aquatica]